jgi:hypothetical protein
VVDLVHQRQQAADLALGHAFPHKPAQVVARQIGDQAALVLAERHGACHQQEQVFGIHLSRPRV